MKNPTRIKDKLPKAISVIPALFVGFLGKYSLIPNLNKRLRVPPTITALLKRRDTSPTPNWLRAFVSQLNHGEMMVDAITIVKIKIGLTIPHNPPNQMVYLSVDFIFV